MVKKIKTCEDCRFIVGGIINPYCNKHKYKHNTIPINNPHNTPICNPKGESVCSFFKSRRR